MFCSIYKYTFIAHPCICLHNTVSSVIIGLVFFMLGTFIPAQILSLFTNDAATAQYGAEYLRTASVNFLLVGIIQPFAAALRSTQQAKYPMFGSIAAFFTDVLFNYVLIFGKFGFPRMEVRGAALATVIARILETLVVLFAVFGRKNSLKGRISGFFGFSREFVSRVFKISAVTTLNEGMWSTANAAISAAFGHAGTVEFAAYSAAITVINLFLMAMFSLGDAALVLVGAKIGENKPEEAKTMSTKLIKMNLVFGIAAGVFIAVFSGVIIRIFKLSPEGYVIARQIMYVNALYCPLYLVNGALVAGIFRAGGDSRYSAVVEAITMWSISVLFAFLGVFVFKLPLPVAVFMSQFENVVKIIILLKRYRSGKWLNYMIEGM